LANVYSDNGTLELATNLIANHPIALEPSRTKWCRGGSRTAPTAYIPSAVARGGHCSNVRI